MCKFIVTYMFTHGAVYDFRVLKDKTQPKPKHI